jgi:hypothetical protein
VCPRRRVVKQEDVNANNVFGKGEKELSGFMFLHNRGKNMVVFLALGLYFLLLCQFTSAARKVSEGTY